LKNLTLRTTASRFSLNLILAALLILPAGFVTQTTAQEQEDTLRARVSEALSRDDLVSDPRRR
jgi:hypothetical protein